MSAFLPGRPASSGPDQDHPRLQERPLSLAEHRARWQVRAAQWRARELAEHVFGAVTRMGLSGMRADGPFRGLLRLDVPFDGLETHREREARFLSAAGSDPVLSSVPLVFVIGPDGA